MNFKKKEPLKAKEVKVTDVVTKVYELHPDRRYLFWFPKVIKPGDLGLIRDHLRKAVSGVEITLVAGMNEPMIYEFDKDDTVTGLPLTPLPWNRTVTGLKIPTGEQGSGDTMKEGKADGKD